MATKTELRTAEKDRERQERRERGRRIQHLKTERDLDLGELATRFKRESKRIYDEYQEKIDRARKHG